MIEYKIGDNVIFIWNNTKFPGVINRIKDDCIYFVEFPHDSLAGMIDIIRPIHKEYLIPNIVEQKIMITI